MDQSGIYLKIINLETREFVLSCYGNGDCEDLFSYFYKFVHEDGYPLYDLFIKTFKHLDESDKYITLNTTKSINQNIIL